MYLSDNPGEFDWTGKLDTPSPYLTFGYAQLVVEFEAEEVNFPIFDPIIEVSGSTDQSDWHEIREGDDSGWSYYLHEGPTDRSKPRQKSYYLHVSGRDTHFGAVKVLAIGNDWFRISVRRVG